MSMWFAGVVVRVVYGIYIAGIVLFTAIVGFGFMYIVLQEVF